MTYVLAAVALLVAVFVGQVAGWKWVLAPLLGLALFRWAVAMLRSMVHGGQASGVPAEAPAPVEADERVLYWCEECGTEALLVVRGTGKPLRHCGMVMHERTEILSS